MEIFRSGALLIFVNILGIWGYEQKQLVSDIKLPKQSINSNKEPNDSEKYKKSGLKQEKSDECMHKLIDYMDSSQAWKDNEFSVDKISVQINYPKHYITQVLNENIKKNFYTFINEYRIKYAMQLIKSPEYKSWSFLAIAFESGFNSKSAFNNFFKKYTGLTPSEFKKANG